MIGNFGTRVRISLAKKLELQCLALFLYVSKRLRWFKSSQHLWVYSWYCRLRTRYCLKSLESRYRPFWKKEVQNLTTEVETPTDLTPSMIESLPLSSNDLSLNRQYWSFDSNNQDASSTTKNKKGFFSTFVDTLGAQYQFQIANVVSAQVSNTVGVAF